jgi:hypothetical protein
MLPISYQNSRFRSIPVRLSDITLHDFMEPVTHEVTERDDFLFNWKEMSRKQWDFHNDYHRGRAGGHVKTDRMVLPIEFSDISGRVSVLGGQKEKPESDKPIYFLGSALIDGCLQDGASKAWILDYLLDDEARIPKAIDLEATSLLSADVGFRISLHREASVRAHLRGEKIHQSNYDSYIAPLGKASKKILSKQSEPYLSIHDHTYDEYCHPEVPIVHDIRDMPFFMAAVRDLTETFEKYRVLLQTKGARGSRLRGFQPGSRSPRSRLFSISGRGVLMTNLDATEALGLVKRGTTFVPEDLRGRGYGKELLTALGGNHEKVLSPTHFSEAGSANRKAAHRDAVIEAHSRGDWIRPAVWEHYADILDATHSQTDTATAAMSI